MERSVANVDGTAKKGIAWRWTPEGRRNIGQCFQVGENLKPRNSPSRSARRWPRLGRQHNFVCGFSIADKGITLGTQVATGLGKLPRPGREAEERDMAGPEIRSVKLEAGRYAFLLEFTEGPAEGQGVVFMIGNTANEGI